MAHRLEVLIEVQAEIQHCRFLADHMPDPEAAERARLLADDLARSGCIDRAIRPAVAENVKFQ
jgi:hypothetical protein